jgi:gamma-glutamyltranspeptidase/glutathione hydrolase
VHASAIEKLKPFPISMKLLMPEGKPFEPGYLFLQHDLARTLEAIAQGGADAFYRGPIAKRTAGFFEANGGLIRLSDLSSYQAEETTPIRTSYKGIDVFQSSPNSQGIVLLMSLNILEEIDLRSMEHNSPEYVHTLVEAMKLAFADRDRYIADPRHTSVPVEQLLSKRYAAKRRKLIRPDKATPGVAPHGDISETSSFSIADRFGNLVSVTHSVNATFGNGVFVEGGGYVINNRLPYFSLEDGHPNILEPGKRPRHTINPALALKDGKPYLAWNTPGGDNQPQAMLQAFLALHEFGMNPQQAVEAATSAGRSNRRCTQGQRPQSQSVGIAAALYATALRGWRGEDDPDRSAVRRDECGGESGQGRLRARLVSGREPRGFLRCVFSGMASRVEIRRSL